MANATWGDLPDVLQEVERIAGGGVVTQYFWDVLKEMELLGDVWLDAVEDEDDLQRCGLFRSNVQHAMEANGRQSSTACVSIVRAWQHNRTCATHEEAVQKMKMTLIGLLPAIDALALLGDCCAD